MLQRIFVVHQRECQSLEIVCPCVGCPADPSLPALANADKNMDTDDFITYDIEDGSSHSVGISSEYHFRAQNGWEFGEFRNSSHYAAPEKFAVIVCQGEDWNTAQWKIVNDRTVVRTFLMYLLLLPFVLFTFCNKHGDCMSLG